MNSLSPEQYLRSLKTSTDTLQSLSRGRLDLEVGDCPGWKVADLIGHVGQVFAMVDAVVVSKAQKPVGPGPEAAPASGRDRSDWFVERCSSVVKNLSNVDPDEPMWTWSARQNAGFYLRRMAHETAVHVCDLQRAVGLGIDMDRSLACDGIDELYIDMITGWAKRNGRSFPSGSLHLHCTDGPGEWLLSPSPDGLEVRHEHSKGDVAWRGPAASLVLAAWGRSDTGIEILGDATISRQWSNFAP